MNEPTSWSRELEVYTELTFKCPNFSKKSGCTVVYSIILYVGMNLVFLPHVFWGEGGQWFSFFAMIHGSEYNHISSLHTRIRSNVCSPTLASPFCTVLCFLFSWILPKWNQSRAVEWSLSFIEIYFWQIKRIYNYRKASVFQYLASEAAGEIRDKHQCVHVWCLYL